MGLLRELVPSATSIAALINPTRPGANAQLAQIQEAAHAIKLPLHIITAASEHDLDAAFSRLALDLLCFDKWVRLMNSAVPACYEGCLPGAVFTMLEWSDKKN
jgi:hypothetical protein